MRKDIERAYFSRRRLSPLPHVGEVPRELAGHDEERVDSDVVAIAHVALRQPLGGDRDSAEAVAVEREGRGLLAPARLNFDEGQGPASARDDIDFAARDSRPAGKNPPPLQAQIPARQSLGPATPAFRLLPVHLRESSSARA
jgi:hypothetical protein